MPSYLHPGVYIEEIPSGARPIEAVGTSTAAFIGYTTKGPRGKPVLILKWDDYDTIYGGLQDPDATDGNDAMGFAVQAFYQNGGTAAYIVRLAASDTSHPLASASGYINHPEESTATNGLLCTALNEGAWANGVRVQFIEKDGAPGLYTVEVGRNNDKGLFSALEVFADVSLDSSSPRYVESVVNDVSQLVTIKVEALSDITTPDGYRIGHSTSGNLRGVKLDFTGLNATQRQLQLRLDGGSTDHTITLPAVNFTGNLVALAENLQKLVRDAATSTTFTCELQTRASTLVLVLESGTSSDTSAVTVSGGVGLAATLNLGTANGGTEEDGAAVLAARIGSNQAELVDGADGRAPADTDSAYTNTYTAFLKYRDINIVCLPGQHWEASGNTAIEGAISHAETMQNRMVLVDPPPSSELTTENDVNALGLTTSTYAALYYPWVKVSNPFYDEESNPGGSATVLTSPGAFAAGMWSKIDARRGVWKAPAGVETNLLGVAGLAYTVEDGEQDQLNPQGVNCLRKLPSYGSVIWGSRTRSTKANPEWRYVPVRRTAMMIEQSIYGGIQWAVFEPNDHRLWSGLRINIDAFMNGLFRAGAFQGEKASDTYFVRCALGDTMTQADIDRGQVIVIVGFAPLKPAEFVIVRIQQKVGQE